MFCATQLPEATYVTFLLQKHTCYAGLTLDVCRGAGSVASETLQSVWICYGKILFIPDTQRDSKPDARGASGCPAKPSTSASNGQHLEAPRASSLEPRLVIQDLSSSYYGGQESYRVHIAQIKRAFEGKGSVQLPGDIRDSSADTESPWLVFDELDSRT